MTRNELLTSRIVHALQYSSNEDIILYIGDTQPHILYDVLQSIDTSITIKLCSIGLQLCNTGCKHNVYLTAKE